MIYINHYFINKLPDKTERVVRNRLEADVCISEQCGEQWPAPQWSFVQAKSQRRWLWYIIKRDEKCWPLRLVVARMLPFKK